MRAARSLRSLAAGAAGGPAVRLVRRCWPMMLAASLASGPADAAGDVGEPFRSQAAAGPVSDPAAAAGKARRFAESKDEPEIDSGQWERLARALRQFGLDDLVAESQLLNHGNLETSAVRQAIRTFQRERGDPVTGILTAAQLHAVLALVRPESPAEPPEPRAEPEPEPKQPWGAAARRGTTFYGVWSRDSEADARRDVLTSCGRGRQGLPSPGIVSRHVLRTGAKGQRLGLGHPEFDRPDAARRGIGVPGEEPRLPAHLYILRRWLECPEPIARTAPCRPARRCLANPRAPFHAVARTRPGRPP
jgi:hypothetical protein